MRIIDARLRPATPMFIQSTLGLVNSTPRFQDYYRWFGFDSLGESVEQVDLDLCIKEMDAAGITSAVIPCRWGKNPEPDVPPEELIRVMNAYPGKFSGIIAASVYNPKQALADAEKYCVNGPCIGLNLEFVNDSPSYPKVNDKKFYPLYEYMQEKSLVYYVTGGGFHGCQPIEYLAQVLTDFPRLTVVDAHAHVPDAIQACFMAFRHENLFLLPDLYVPNTFFDRIYLDAAKSMLQDQIVFGTAYPFMPLKGMVDYYLNWPLPDAILEKVMAGNIARALNI